LTEALEGQRVEKDGLIRELTDEKEDQRRVFESRINELEVLCKRQELEVAEFRSAVEEMKLEITRLADVEAQLNN